MSIAVMSQVWKRSRASHGPLLLLLAIADFADDEGQAFPSIATLQKKSRLSASAAHNALKTLQELGELEIRMGEGRFGTNLYRIIQGGVEINPPSRNWTPPPLQKLGGPPSEIGGTPPLESGPNTSIEPSIEPIPPNPLKGDGLKTEGLLPTSEMAKRISVMFHRKLTTEWDKAEITAYKAFVKTKPDAQELAMVEEFYAAHWPPGSIEDIYLRKSLLTFLRHYSGEIDKARAWKDYPHLRQTRPKNGLANGHREPITAENALRLSRPAER